MAEDVALRRPASFPMDQRIGEQIPVLDHGFIRLIDYMGDDAAVVQAARVSYGDGTKSYREDEGLIRYLMRNQHTSPFEQCELKLHCKMPIFVARQWIRHRTANVNEYSMRYSEAKDEFYIPDREHLAAQSTSNRQGRGAVIDDDDPEMAGTILRMLQHDAENAYADYSSMLTAGLARELARMNLSVNYYTEWYWKIDLHNLFHFLKLRTDTHAQYEIRVYAQAIDALVSQWVPMCYRAYVDYMRDAVTFSRPEMQVLRAVFATAAFAVPTGDNAVLSAAELREFMAKLKAEAA